MPVATYERRVLSIQEVVGIVGLSRSTILRRVESGEFPAPINLGGPKSRRIGWLSDEIYVWMDQQSEARLSPTYL